MKYHINLLIILLVYSGLQAAEEAGQIQKQKKLQTKEKGITKTKSMSTEERQKQLEKRRQTNPAQKIQPWWQTKAPKRAFAQQKQVKKMKKSPFAPKSEVQMREDAATWNKLQKKVSKKEALNEQEATTNEKPFFRAPFLSF